MKKTFAVLFSLTLATAGLADQSGPTLGDRVRNPWFIMLGSFAGSSELGTIFNSSNFQFSNCPGAQSSGPDLAVLESLGLELGLGFDVALAPVDLRFSSRVQTFGLTNNESLARPHSVFGVDALFRSNQVYFGPGIGIGYASARTSGLTFQGVPTRCYLRSLDTTRRRQLSLRHGSRRLRLTIIRWHR